MLCGQWICVAISVIFGIATAYSSFSIVPFLIFGCYCVVCFSRTSLPILSLIILAFGLTYVYATYVDAQNDSMLSFGETDVIGTIQSTPIINGNRLSFQLRMNNDKTVQLFYKIPSRELKEKLKQLTPGMVCTFTGTLKEPPSPRNFYAFDYKDYLYKQHIHALFEVESLSNCVQKDMSFVHWLFSMRQAAVSYIGETFSGQSAAFMNALLFGDRQYMTFEVEEQYQQFGLVHLLAISGSHIVLLTAICYFVSLRIGMTRESTTMLLLVCIPLYMFCAGASPSVVRASIAAVIVFGALTRAVRVSGMDALSMTLIIMLFYDPYVLFDIGFQFSFVGSFSLLLSSSRLLVNENGIVKNSIYLSVISQLTSTPILLYHFGSLSPYSILLNMIYVPFLSLLVLPVCIVILVCLICLPIVSQWLADLLSLCIHVSNVILQMCEALPFVRLTFGQTQPFLVVLYCISIVTVLLSWEGLIWRKYRLLFLTIFFLLSTCHYAFPYVNATGSVTYIDVGQGDAILIRLPYNQGTYLIDTGGTLPVKKEKWQQKKHEFSVGHDILVPFLQKEGVRVIDKLIVTHGDMDHMGAAQEVMQSIAVKEVVLGKKIKFSLPEQQIQQLAAQKNVSVRIVEKGDSWKAGETEFSVLSPEGEEKEDNNQSIVLWTKIGGLTWLFTGDLEEVGEKRFIQWYPELHADVLKVGHHGSRTSSSGQFLDAVQPKKAIISVGEHNRYGHPHIEVLERLKERGIEVWRTDEQGAISYVFRGETGTFHSKLTYDEIQKKRRLPHAAFKNR
ncbi:DNA internalization-related competence protein ComEC/Rec2 [Bacillus sp. WLY-B-L8]|uniref:DNA internalization-related competence protein ComEC/Rec2 n=1 Tax=Bacillus multifaciens TaxID=3068506 RepID=UPI00274276CA|nr:DNA internalization-related competence protein ComEC/Rec2 [Bacillus sp. WLY-B-L8]MDP7977255.1 DNA internalization-related competence protein ComEC/Rec2 [Bacillus sp. WLY-B-L8]